MQTTCPVCSRRGGREFVYIPAAPVYCNLLFPTADEARSVPRADIRLALCPACGMIWNADFEPRLMSYAGDYENSLSASATFREYATKLASRLVETYDIRGKDVIEIGCGRGEFLAELCHVGGNRGLGLDPSTAASAGPRDASIRMVRAEYSGGYRDEPVDLLVCRHVLEHVPAPGEFLSSIREMLGDRRDTIVYVEVPDGGSMLEDLAVWDVIYEHRSCFSAPAMERAFERSGFAVRRASSEYHGQFLSIDATPDGRAGRREGSGGSRVKELQRLASRFGAARTEAIERWGARLATWRASERRVVLWGAGSKGVMFLNSVPGVGGIDAVVDANPRKHGMFASGTGHLIVSPRSLREAPPDVVVVLNPAYEREIASALGELGLAAEVVVSGDDREEFRGLGSRSSSPPPRAGTGHPRVSIGLPVRNGERYLERALDSLLAQTMSDLEIIICDNASEDGTREICLRYAQRDPRIRYHRSATNIGAARNFNRAFELSSGEFFKWAAHDDWCDPTFLERCLAVLDDSRELVLCGTAVVIVDADGVPAGSQPPPDCGASSPLVRGHRWLRSFEPTPPVFGVIRAEALRRTRLMGSEIGADKVLLMELALLGPWRLIPDPLLHCFIARRRGAGLTPKDPRSGPWRRSRPYPMDRISWWDPRNVRRAPLWRWRFLVSLVRAVLRSRTPAHVRAVLALEAVARSLRSDTPQLFAELGWLANHVLRHPTRLLAHREEGPELEGDASPPPLSRPGRWA
jgi:glycosyltransferase involved in cell wall biosynthesis/SAM-dependent methyltransferase